MNKEFNESAAQKLLTQVSVEEIMTKDVKTVQVEDPFSHVEKTFVDYHFNHIPIIDMAGKLVGIITQKDLYKIISPRKVVEQTLEYDKDKIFDGNAYYSKELLDSFILEHVMTKRVYTLGVHNTIGEAIHVIISNGVTSVVIVDDNKKVIGIITRFDIIKFLDKIFLAGEQE